MSQCLFKLIPYFYFFHDVYKNSDKYDYKILKHVLMHWKFINNFYF